MKIYLNNKFFLDENFRKVLSSKLGISEGDEITEEKIRNTISLEVTHREITDLTGIEHFTALRQLWCSNNQLTELDVSNNTALTTLACYNNQLTSLDVLNNTALTTLWCDNNRLMELDVTENHQLIRLYVDDNVEVYSSPNLNKNLLIIRET